MGTRGAYGYQKDNDLKIGYCHNDAYPSDLGNQVLNYLKGKELEELIDDYNKIRLINEDEFTKIYASVIEPHVNLNRMEAHIKTGVMTDESDFLEDSMSCEYAYIINLDSKKLEIYVGFITEKPKGRFVNSKPDEDGYYPVSLFKEYDFKDLPKELIDEDFEDEEFDDNDDDEQKYSEHNINSVDLGVVLKKK